MAEDKKSGIAGVPNMYWRYIAAFLIFFSFIYVWNVFFSTGAPERYTINYTQFMEQLNAGNVKSVSIKNLHVER